MQQDYRTKYFALISFLLLQWYEHCYNSDKSDMLHKKVFIEWKCTFASLKFHMTKIQMSTEFKMRPPKMTISISLNQILICVAVFGKISRFNFRNLRSKSNYFQIGSFQYLYHTYWFYELPCCKCDFIAKSIDTQKFQQ